MLTQPEVLQLAHNRAQQRRRQHQPETDQETDENTSTLTAVGQGLSYDYLVGLVGQLSNPA
ncbi:hypothetical protein JYT71_00575 [Acidimicrobiaceae bacterium AH-315-P05]|nr:hypothetical protein [Acidimicrobiaceae bacterium AH-315-P05]